MAPAHPVWVILTDTMAQGPVIGCWDEVDGVTLPTFFATQQEAEAEIADNLITQLQQVIDGDRELDSVSTMDWVEPAVWDPTTQTLRLDHDGTIWTADDLNRMH